MRENPERDGEQRGADGSRVVYQMKVILRGIRPPIWRRIQVTGDTLLWSLHGILQSVMGWEDEHHHQFLIDGECYGDPSLSCSYLKVFDEESVSLSKVAARERAGLLYQYGSDKLWNHEILVERILFRGDKRRYPVCLEGERACPPDYCTGPFEYRRFLKALNDPSGAEDREVVVRGNGDFDAERFAIEDVNRRLGWS